MKKIMISIVALAVVLASCTGTSKNEESAVDSTMADSTVQVAAVVDTAQTMGSELVAQKKACKAAFESIKTSKDFVAAYHLLCKLEADMNAIYDKTSMGEDYSALEAQTNAMMGNQLPWIVGDITGEGTVPISGINNKPLAQSAKLSPETDDDDFVDFLISVFGESGSSLNGLPVWLTMNCDVCYSSLLGTGKTFDVLKKADLLKAKSQMFAPDVDSVLSPLFTGYDNVYEASQSEILAEIDKITRNIKLSDKQLEHITKCREMIADTAKSHFQINCSNGNCNY